MATLDRYRAVASLFLLGGPGCNGDTVTPSRTSTASDSVGPGDTEGLDSGAPPQVTSPGDSPITIGPLDSTTGEFSTSFGDEYGTTFYDETDSYFGTTYERTDSTGDWGTDTSGEATSFGTTSFGGTSFGGTSLGGTSFQGTDTVRTSGNETGGPLLCVDNDLGSVVGTAVAQGSNAGAGDDLSQNCGDGDGSDVIYLWTPPNAGTWTFDTNGSQYDTVLTLFHSCNDGAAFACDDDGGTGTQSQIVVDLDEGETIIVAVEGWNDSTGDFQLNIDGIVTGGTTDDGTTDDGTTDDSTTDDGTTGGDPLAAFEAPQPFGDSVLETDLIGTWNLPTDGSGPGYSMSLTIAADGAFVWEELDDGCLALREGTGTLWVAGAQLVMLFETFDGLAPWPVFDQFGFDAEAPFLIRAGYAPVLGHIALTAPAEMRLSLPWASRGYRRTVGGTTGLDIWVSETELWDVAPGESTAEIIARDRWILDVVAGPTATLTSQRFWYSDGVQGADPAVVQVLPYTDDLVGNLALDGAAYTYVGSAMASYEPGDNFQLDAPTACP